MGIAPLVIIAILGTLITAVALWPRVGRVPDPDLFLATHDLAPTAASRALAHRFLWRERWWRLVGAWTGFGAASGYLVATDTGATLGVIHLTAILVGSSIGVAWASRPPRHRQDPTRSASLAARSLSDYLAPRARTVELVATIVAVAGSLIGALFAFVDGHERLGWRMLALGAASVTATLLVRWIQRQVVGARRSLLDDELTAVDDARRGSTVLSLHHSLVAGLCCVGIYIVAGLGMLATAVEVRFDGDVVHRAEPSTADWRVDPTPEGGVVLSTGDGGLGGQQVTISPPPGVAPPIDIDRWTISNVDNGMMGLIDQSTSGRDLVVPAVVLVLLGAAIGEWSRIRRAPYRPLIHLSDSRRARRITENSAPQNS